MAYTTLVAGTTITAAWANASVRDQTVSPFASAAARSSAITSPVEGMVTHLNDTNCLGVYSGAAWSSIGPMHGALTAWTPVLQQGVGVACTVDYARYEKIGRRYNCQFYITATAAGSANTAIQIGGLPATPQFAQFNEVGSGHFIDVSSGNLSAPFTIVVVTATSTLQLWAAAANSATPQVGLTAGPAAFTVASGDVITGTFWFEATADA